jgi:hypothetical protein
VHPHPQQAGAGNTIMTECTLESGHLQSMYSLVCGPGISVERLDWNDKESSDIGLERLFKGSVAKLRQEGCGVSKVRKCDIAKFRGCVVPRRPFCLLAAKKVPEFDSRLCALEALVAELKQ